jgi:membrane-associated phospholipid phosphatase
VGALLLCFFEQQVLFAFVNTHYSDAGNYLMVWCSDMGEAPFIVTTALFTFLVAANRNIWHFLCLALCLSMPSVVTQLIKHWLELPRPMAVYEGAQWLHHIDSWPLLRANSFPSGHTTGAFSLFSVLAWMLPRRYRYFGLFFCILALSVAYARLYLAAHFFADVYAGSICGTLVALFFYVLVLKLKHWYLYRNERKR